MIGETALLPVGIQTRTDEISLSICFADPFGVIQHTGIGRVLIFVQRAEHEVARLFEITETVADRAPAVIIAVHRAGAGHRLPRSSRTMICCTFVGAAEGLNGCGQLPGAVIDGAGVGRLHDRGLDSGQKRAPCTCPTATFRNSRTRRRPRLPPPRSRPPASEPPRQWQSHTVVCGLRPSVITGRCRVLRWRVARRRHAAVPDLRDQRADIGPAAVPCGVRCDALDGGAGRAALRRARAQHRGFAGGRVAVPAADRAALIVKRSAMLASVAPSPASFHPVKAWSAKQ